MPVRAKTQFLKFLVILVALAAALAVIPAAAERLRIIPVPPDMVAQWTPLPDLPQVYYAPNLPTDVFRHRGRYYFFWAGIWYQSKKIKGPWTRLDQPPAILSRIQTSYFKSPPQVGVQPPGGAAPGGPPPEGLVTPEGKPVLPPPPPSQPTAPVPPTPPTGAYALPPQEPVAPQPPAPATPPPPPKSQKSAPPAVPDGPLPKAM